MKTKQEILDLLPDDRSEKELGDGIVANKENDDGKIKIVITINDNLKDLIGTFYIWDHCKKINEVYLSSSPYDLVAQMNLLKKYASFFEIDIDDFQDKTVEYKDRVIEKESEHAKNTIKELQIENASLKGIVEICNKVLYKSKVVLEK